MNHTSRLAWLLALSSFAALVPAIDGTPLRMVGKVGDVRHYKTSATLTLSDGATKGQVSSDVAQKVSAVAPDGSITLVNTPSNLIFKIAQQVLPSEVPAAIVEVHGADGALVSLHCETPLRPEQYRLTFLESIKYPTTPLDKDKSWTWDIPADGATGVAKTKIDFKVLGEEKVDGVDCWKISRIALETEGDSPASLDGIIWVAKLDGSLVKRTDNWKNMPVAGVPPFKDASTAIELVPGG